MSIQKVVESEGHGSFYSLISLSFAVLWYPHYQWLLPYVSSGLPSSIDTAILIIGATGVITGVLYAIPLDRSIDWIIQYKAGHEPRLGRLHYIPTRKRNQELFRFIAGTDYLASTWRTPSWISLEDSCKHALASAMSDPNIQKMIWGLKNRAAVGLTFMLWGIALWGRGITPLFDNVSIVAILIGCLFLFIPWFIPSSLKIPTIIRQVSSVRYVEDTFSIRRSLGRERPKSSDRPNNR